MELRNRIKAEIYEQGYKSIAHFCEENDLPYQKILRLATSRNTGFNFESIVAVCGALNKDVGDLFYIEREPVSQ